MIPASYLFRDIYDQHWANPSDLRPVEALLPRQRRRKGYVARIYSFITTMSARRSLSAPMMQNCSVSDR